jgi:hypothetical protein
MLLKLQKALILSNIEIILFPFDKTLGIEKINKEGIIRVEVQYYFFIFLNNSTNLEFVSSLCNFVREETVLIQQECLIHHKFDISTLK